MERVVKRNWPLKIAEKNFLHQAWKTVGPDFVSMGTEAWIDTSHDVEDGRYRGQRLDARAASAMSVQR